MSRWASRESGSLRSSAQESVLRLIYKSGKGLVRDHVREEDGVELIVSRFNARNHVDIRPPPKLVVRLELDIEVEFDPSFDPSRQVHLVSCDGFTPPPRSADPVVYQRQTVLSTLSGKSAILGA